VINTVGGMCSSDDSACVKSYTQSNGQTGGVPNKGTRWHTYGVEWTPSGVTWLIDGRVIYTAPASKVKSPAKQPAIPMNMGLQSQNLAGAGTPTRRETMTVDWAEQFSWNG
jgi:beta-glucanase (GH16 family)